MPGQTTKGARPCHAPSRRARIGAAYRRWPFSRSSANWYAVYAAARLAGDTPAGQELALGWRGDQLDVYELDAGGAAARWHVELASAQHAASFATLLEQNPRISVRQRGADVVGVVSESGSKPEWLFGPLAR